MARVALTFWFTIATLAGPWVCCCSFAASPKTTSGSNQVPASKPVKSCCHTDAPPCGEHGKQNPDPTKPSKCPCEHGKQHVTSLPTSGQEGTDLVAQLKLLDALFVGILAPSAFDFLAVRPTRTDTSTSPSKLAGRDLLAVYSLLRC